MLCMQCTCECARCSSSYWAGFAISGRSGAEHVTMRATGRTQPPEQRILQGPLPRWCRTTAVDINADNLHTTLSDTDMGARPAHMHLVHQ
jgi:hypothetical protein